MKRIIKCHSGLSRITFVFFSLLLFTLIFPCYSFAIENPLSVPNNKFGIHIVDENDLGDVVNLVNSGGGDWGYTVMVITEHDRNTAKWQKTFDRMRENHIIPIIRLATSATKEGWRKPDISDIPAWIQFLNSLNWVVENRYIILFNEPNHAKEWGGTIDPAGYTAIVEQFSKELKKASMDYFILNAGFDQATNNNHQSIDELNYLTQMYQSNPNIFTYFDGWVSHSYPNPNFSGSPQDTGKGSINGFKWEIQKAGDLGLKKDIPVFITETGWTHAEGKDMDYSFNTAKAVSSFIQTALDTVWSDPQIAVIAPFLLNYQDNPFDHFSWKQLNSNLFYPQYEVYKQFQKQKGAPTQKIRADLSLDRVPEKLFTDSLFYLPIQVTNSGQSIWSPTDQITLTLSVSGESTNSSSFLIEALKPFEKKTVKISLKTQSDPASYTLTAKVVSKDKSLSVPIAKTIYTQVPKTITDTVLFFIRKIIEDYSQAPVEYPRG